MSVVHRCLSEMASNGRETAIIEIPKDYVVILQEDSNNLIRASCKTVFHVVFLYAEVCAFPFSGRF